MDESSKDSDLGSGFFESFKSEKSVRGRYVEF